MQYCFGQSSSPVKINRGIIQPTREVLNNSMSYTMQGRNILWFINARFCCRCWLTSKVGHTNQPAVLASTSQGSSSGQTGSFNSLDNGSSSLYSPHDPIQRYVALKSPAISGSIAAVLGNTQHPDATFIASFLGCSFCIAVFTS